MDENFFTKILDQIELMEILDYGSLSEVKKMLKTFIIANIKNSRTYKEDTEKRKNDFFFKKK